ncbi:hypothetical protein NS220_01990 [Microbacterium testaceum]|uniref:Uncharacterized protein n=1 Tax=Microbacterium testaceum TaxID=2033 RepID=A0A147F1J2_MICTE|nr:hypothetical protein NS220_01990 [Microbacterium testaceum]
MVDLRRGRRRWHARCAYVGRQRSARRLRWTHHSIVRRDQHERRDLAHARLPGATGCQRPHRPAHVDAREHSSPRRSRIHPIPWDQLRRHRASRPAHRHELDASPRHGHEPTHRSRLRCHVQGGQRRLLRRGRVDRSDPGTPRSGRCPPRLLRTRHAGVEEPRQRRVRRLAVHARQHRR